MAGFDAIVAADARHSAIRVAGLTLVERARRVALRCGAEQVLVVDAAGDGDEVAHWARPDVPVLVIDARDQVVHSDLVREAVTSDADRVVVTDAGGYAGALWARGSAVAELIDALAEAPDKGDAVVAERWLAGGATRIELADGAIAHHRAVTRDERRAAARMLYRIIHKGQDGPVTRYVYRPVSLPITKLLLPTPITPNHVTLFCAVLSAVGIYLTASYQYASVLWGAVLIQIAAFLDGCDGEIARLKLQSSTIGAWLDTLVDEATSVGYVVALGYHVYLRYGYDWLYSSIFVALATHLVTIYVIYYYIIVVARSGNSQDYQHKVRIVEGEGDEPPRLEPVPEGDGPSNPVLAWCAEYFPHVLRRDFLSLMALGLVAFKLTHVLYAILIGGSIVAVVWLVPEHLMLRLKLRKLNQPRT